MFKINKFIISRVKPLLGLLLFCMMHFNAFSHPENHNYSWEHALEYGNGELTVYWYESKPFIFKNTAGKLTGIEFDILINFQSYLLNKHGVKIQLNWKEADSFRDTYRKISNKDQNGIIGLSAFSITPKRQREVNFTPAYMSDISVIVNSNNIPILNSISEFKYIFSKLKAITIKETTYEQELFKMQGNGISFKIEYINSQNNILKTIEKKDSVFGYIDLPVYLMMYNENPSMAIKRQNLYPIKREGYAFIYPKGSDWQIPLEAFFTEPGFLETKESIIAKYIDLELYLFFENLVIDNYDPVELLTKEKEIQGRDLIYKSLKIEEEVKRRKLLIFLLVITGLSFIVIALLFTKSINQKKKIAQQRQNIEIKNEELKKRNAHLNKMDEEKNNLIRILAHDLRAPIGQINGLSNVFLLSNKNLPEEQTMIIEEISEASVRLQKMISKILDLEAVENNTFNIQFEALKLFNTLQQVIKNMKKEALKKNISIEFQPNCDDIVLNADEIYLMEVFENLISNAIKFSECGKKIEINVTEKDNFVLIGIKDQGPGLTEVDKALLFKKFQRLSAQPTAGEVSIGLGLSIVKKYVNLMNGSIWCESESGKGANFIVKFEKHVPRLEV